jgi:predicted nucleotidyltransferase
MKEEVEAPPSLKDDLSEAVEILKGFGAAEVYVFGSLARGDHHAKSDIDIATVGLPKDRFFAAYGALLMRLDHPFDLVGLDYGNEFARRLRDEGQLLRVA